MEESPLEAHLRLIGMVAKGAPLPEALDAALRYCEGRSPDMLCSILLLDSDGRSLRHGAAPSLPAGYVRAIDGLPIGPRAGSCGTAVFRGEPVETEDILSDPLWEGYRELATPYGLRACWSTPIKDAAGEVLGSFAIYYRKPGLPTAAHRETILLITHIASIAVAACRAERERRQVFERISDAFVALDRDWRYVYVNRKAAEHLGRRAEDLIGRRIWSEFPEGYGREFRLACERAMAQQEPMTLEEPQPAYGRWFEYRIYPSPQALTLYFCDVTQRKRGEERLRKAERLAAIGQLAGGVAHDFNNQLSVILGYAGLLESRAADPEAKRYASAILRAAKRSGDLTRNLLAYSRQGNYENVPVDLHELIGEVRGRLARGPDARIEVALDLRADRPVILGDPASLQNALLNLAWNAREAMPQGGILAFRTTGVRLPDPAGKREAWADEADDLPPGRYLRLEVADTGAGMGEAVRRRLFEPFFSTKPPGLGTGLGLASVFGTVRTHGGRIAVESEEGRGTAFHLLFPEADAPGPKPPGPGGAPARGLTVLVVDDDASVREIMKDMLQAGGHAVLEASRGREALELYRNRAAPIDLVILDLLMPDMDGAATFQALIRLDPEARVVISTGYPGDAQIPALMASGVKGLLQKPYEKSRLDTMIAAVMAGSRSPA